MSGTLIVKVLTNIESPPAQATTFNRDLNIHRQLQTASTKASESCSTLKIPEELEARSPQLRLSDPRDPAYREESINQTNTNQTNKPNKQ